MGCVEVKIDYKTALRSVEVLESKVNELRESIRVLEKIVEEEPEAKRELRFLKEKLKIIENVVLPAAREIDEKVRKGEPVPDELISKASSITCFGDLSYCCALTNNCPYRDIARLALKLPDDMFTFKSDLTRAILRLNFRSIKASGR